MVLLDKNDYCKIKPLLNSVTFNTLFAKSVIEDKVDGTVHVDDVQSPLTAYIVHPYGMSLLIGATDNEQFNSKFRNHALNAGSTRKSHEWMQAFPLAWNDVLKKLLGSNLIRAADNSDKQTKEIVELNTRINFKFNSELYYKQKKIINEPIVTVVPVNKLTFTQMNGSVVPKHFWRNAEQFLSIGAGFSIFHGVKLASMAYSAFVQNDNLELGIETVEEFRGKGYAHYACSFLIDYCIEKKYEPIWACSKENKGSYRLARKLGFEPIREIPYYRLSN